MRNPIKIEKEIDLIVQTRNELPDYHPWKEWLTKVWENSSATGWLRGDYENENMQKQWDECLRFCRDIGIISESLV